MRNNNDSFIRFLTISSDFTYTLVAPIILMVGLYYFFSKYVFHAENKLILIIMILLGLVSGYVSLYKRIKEK